MVHTYSLKSYGTMLNDRRRSGAYLDAIRSAVNSSSVVLEIGTGPGIFALAAARCGARHVYGVDPDHSIALAREAALVAGCQDRVTFIRNVSSEINLPERATVVIGDLRGVLPLFQSSIASIVDARMRLATDDATWIPSVDRVYAALATAPEEYSQWVGPWEQFSVGGDLDHIRRRAVNDWYKVYLRADQVVSAAECLWTLAYHTVTSRNYGAAVTWQVPRGATVHGVALWFDADLASGIQYSNAPWESPLVYGQAFFPFEQPLTLGAGQTCAAEIRADVVNGEYVWSWSAQTDTQRLDHCTLAALPLDGETLRDEAPSRVPRLNAAGRRDRLLLGLFDGRRSLGEIAQGAAAQVPGWSGGEALLRAVQLYRRYCDTGEASRPTSVVDASR